MGLTKPSHKGNELDSSITDKGLKIHDPNDDDMWIVSDKNVANVQNKR